MESASSTTLESLLRAFAMATTRVQQSFAGAAVGWVGVPFLRCCYADRQYTFFLFLITRQKKMLFISAWWYGMNSGKIYTKVFNNSAFFILIAFSLHWPQHKTSSSLSFGIFGGKWQN